MVNSKLLTQTVKIGKMAKTKMATTDEIIIAALNNGDISLADVVLLSKDDLMKQLDKGKLRLEITQRKMLTGIGASFIKEIQSSVAMKAVVKNSPELKVRMDYFGLDVKDLIKVG